MLHDELQMQSELARCAVMWWWEGKDARAALHDMTRSARDRGKAAVALVSPHMSVADRASPCSKTRRSKAFSRCIIAGEQSRFDDC